MTNINDEHVEDVGRWIVYNIEELSLQYMEAESSLPFELYIRNRAVVAFQNKFQPGEVREIFDDHRIQIIISFFQEDRDEFSDQIH